MSDKGKQIYRGVHVSFVSMLYDCPHCGRGYDDADEKVFTRSVNNKCGYATQKCDSCKKRFGVAMNYNKMIGFTINGVYK